jgi:hypothetical protein
MKAGFIDHGLADVGTNRGHLERHGLVHGHLGLK